MIELVSGYRPHTEISKVSVSVRDILGDFSPVVQLQSQCQSGPPVTVSPQSAPSETKQSASNSRLANIARPESQSVSDNMRSPLSPL